MRMSCDCFHWLRWLFCCSPSCCASCVFLCRRSRRWIPRSSRSRRSTPFARQVSCPPLTSSSSMLLFVLQQASCRFVVACCRARVPCLPSSQLPLPLVHSVLLSRHLVLNSALTATESCFRLPPADCPIDAAPLNFLSASPDRSDHCSHTPPSSRLPWFRSCRLPMRS